MKMAQIANGRRYGQMLTLQFDDGTIECVKHTEANYQRIVDAIVAGATDDEVYTLVNPAWHVERQLHGDDHQTTDIERALIVGLVDRGCGDKSIVKVIHDLRSATNPVMATDALRAWVTAQDKVQVLADGRIIAYKRVDSNGFSLGSGYGEITRDGVTTIVEDGHIRNEVGSVISMPLDKADTVGVCGKGLHLGTFDFARSFCSGRMFAVSFSAKDILDGGVYKLRVLSYKVLRELDDVDAMH